MATILKDFLLDISSDSEKYERFKSDPDAEMDTAGLSDEDKDTIKSGDPVRIRNSISSDYLADSTVVVVVAVVVVV